MTGSQRLAAAAVGGTLFWLADQPAVDGYAPFAALLWTPRFWQGPSFNYAVMLAFWMLGALCCHFLLFSLQRLLRR